MKHVSEIHLGDGVYALFDGCHVRLRVPRDGGAHVISLNPNVYKALIKWINHDPELKLYMEN